MSYKGYERKDNIAGKIACIFAIGVALCPTKPDVNPNQSEIVIGNLHLAFAVCFFLSLTYFSLFLFTKTDSRKTPTRRKRQRNVIYRVCGYTMAACILMIGPVAWLSGNALITGLHLTFWLESAAILAFGISWLTKGEAILKDLET